MVPRRDAHADRVAGRMREQLADCLALSDATTREDASWAESVIASGLHALERDFQPTFVHRDFTLGNTVFEAGEERWRLSGVFDLQEWYVGDPEEDLARTAVDLVYQHPTLAHTFLSAYFERRPRREGFAERLAVYVLADRLGIWHYMQANGLWRDEKRTLRDWIEPALAKVLEATPR